MPCVGRPCASARTRWSAVVSAILSWAPARRSASLASRNNSSGFFFIIADSKSGSKRRQGTMGKMIELTAADGHKLAAYRAEPAGKPRGAIVVIQEIFGVNSHIKSVADGYAQDGYLAIAPAMFDRLQRGYDTGYSQPEIQAGIAMMQKLDWKNTMADVQAAIDEAKKAGKVGIVGYCYGGTFGLINEKPKVPVMAHFGEQDQSPTLEQAKAIAKAHPEIEPHYYAGAG